jgi:hypothetical protein
MKEEEEEELLEGAIFKYHKARVRVSYVGSSLRLKLQDVHRPRMYHL